MPKNQLTHDGMRQQPESAGMWPELFRKHLTLLAYGLNPHHTINTYCVPGKVGRLRIHMVGGLPSRHLGREQQGVEVQCRKWAESREAQGSEGHHWWVWQRDTTRKPGLATSQACHGCERNIACGRTEMNKPWLWEGERQRTDFQEMVAMATLQLQTVSDFFRGSNCIYWNWHLHFLEKG